MKPLINWGEVRKANDLRERIVLAIAESDGPRSPKELSKQLEEGLSQVSYHVKELFKGDCLILKKQEPRRGAVEHFYALAPKVLLKDTAKDYEAGLEAQEQGDHETAARLFAKVLAKLTKPVTLPKPKPKKKANGKKKPAKKAKPAAKKAQPKQKKDKDSK